MGWFLRKGQWARRPPSWGRVKLMAGIVAVCLGLAGIEAVWGWPDWLTTAGGGRPLRP